MNVFLLGCTGVIGTKVLEVCRRHADRFHVVGLTAGRRVRELMAAAQEFGVRYVRAADREGLQKAGIPAPMRELRTDEEVCQVVASPEVDMLVCAVSGTSGLRPVLAALECGKPVALASKEILVMAGKPVTEMARRHGGKLLPVDSEHCAIFQCLDQEDPAAVRRIILTASGGPFRKRPAEEFESITVEEALHHPVWHMGHKITIDSASMMNKGLEVIEAKWLFGVEEPQIEVVIHPQSIVHSMVEFKDSTVMAQMACPDMTLPIQYCMTYPERCPSICPRMDFTQAMTLTFEAPDTKKFPALDLARHVLREPERPLGAVFNAANEVAVDAFVARRLSFAGISRVVAKTLERCEELKGTDLECALNADAEARRIAAELVAAGI